MKDKTTEKKDSIASDAVKEQIRKIILALGAEVCGVANIDLFSDAPKGFHPAEIYKDCRSVIVFAKVIPKGTAMVSPRIVYQHYNEIVKEELDKITYLAANEIEKNIEDAIAVPLPSDGPYDYWDAENMSGRGLISMKHAAVLAGLGQMGKSTILLNERYGNRLTIGAILTNLDITSDAPAENICIKDCHICIDNCPAHAISENSVDQKLCRTNTYKTNERGFNITTCNNCRTKCPMRFGNI